MEKYYSINQKGMSIRCKLYCADIKKIRSVVVFGHGFSGHKDNRAAEKLAQRIQKRQPETALVIFNWPCHGDDASNKLRLSDCMTYLGTVIGEVKERFHTQEIYGCATSFGGYLFLKYIAEHGNPFRAVALRCPAVNMYAVMTEVIMTDAQMKTVRKGKTIQVGFDRKVKITSDFLSDIKESDITALDYHPYSGDITIVQGTKDEIVSYESVRDFAQKNEIAFIPVEAADHRFTDPAKMDAAINAFLSAFGMK